MCFSSKVNHVRQITVSYQITTVKAVPFNTQPPIRTSYPESMNIDPVKTLTKAQVAIAYVATPSGTDARDLESGIPADTLIVFRPTNVIFLRYPEAHLKHTYMKKMFVWDLQIGVCECFEVFCKFKWRFLWWIYGVDEVKRPTKSKAAGLIK